MKVTDVVQNEMILFESSNESLKRINEKAFLNCMNTTRNIFQKQAYRTKIEIDVKKSVERNKIRPLNLE
jgi:hypothetical protein